MRHAGCTGATDVALGAGGRVTCRCLSCVAGAAGGLRSGTVDRGGRHRAPGARVVTRLGRGPRRHLLRPAYRGAVPQRGAFGHALTLCAHSVGLHRLGALRRGIGRGQAAPMDRVGVGFTWNSRAQVIGGCGQMCRRRHLHGRGHRHGRGVAAHAAGNGCRTLGHPLPRCCRAGRPRRCHGQRDPCAHGTTRDRRPGGPAKGRNGSANGMAQEGLRDGEQSLRREGARAIMGGAGPARRWSAQA